MPIYRSVGTACAGDLDGLIAVPSRQSPWVASNQPGVATRRRTGPRANGDIAATAGVALHDRRPARAPRSLSAV